MMHLVSSMLEGQPHASCEASIGAGVMFVPKELLEVGLVLEKRSGTLKLLTQGGH